MSDTALSRAILPEGWPTPRGYANGMVAQGRVLVTGGLVGWDEAGIFAQGLHAAVAADPAEHQGGGRGWRRARSRISCG